MISKLNECKRKNSERKREKEKENVTYDTK